ncbi:MAG TPA: lysophospholipid acyltransferase family protein [Dehalococcoidia bacterium]|nr:lysophospholipid acyltransferase family protein [Dehalococcoidia bacterium]
MFHTLFYWLNVLSWPWLLVVLCTRRTIRGRKNIPRQGPLILASNHLNLSDPPIITVLTPRRIVWMAKKELFDIPVIGILYRLYGLIPVRRFEADLAALRRAERALRRGQVLGMFPEGTRTGKPGLRPAEPGTALLALRAGVPVLPVAIWGTEGMRFPAALFRRTDVSIAFGEPFRLPRPKRITKEDVEAGADEIMRRIAALLPPEYRGAYGDAAPKKAPPASPQRVSAAGERDA